MPLVSHNVLDRMIGLDEVTEKERETLSGVENGLWALDGEGVAHDLGVRSVFMLSGANNDLYRYGTRLFASGAVSDRLLKMLAAKEEVKETTLIVRDFTKLFITPEVYADYTKRGGELKVLQRSRLVALTLNPTSPHGYAVDSEKACGALEEALGMPVYDVRRENCMKRP